MERTLNESLSQEKQSEVVVVDDDETMGQFLQALLSYGLDADVKVFQSPVAALAYMKESKDPQSGFSKVDAVLSDFNMPGMTGHEFLVELRSYGIDIPVVFLSGFLDQRTLMEALRLGAFDVMAKPPVGEVTLRTMQLAMRVGQRKNEIHNALKLLKDHLSDSGLDPEASLTCKLAIDQIKEHQKNISLLLLRNFASATKRV